MNLTTFYLAFGALILAPVLGGLVAGVDRVVTARLQSRMGPPLLQPFYDVGKLWSKVIAPASHWQGLLVRWALVASGCGRCGGTLFGTIMTLPRPI